MRNKKHIPWWVLLTLLAVCLIVIFAVEAAGKRMCFGVPVVADEDILHAALLVTGVVAFCIMLGFSRNAGVRGRNILGALHIPMIIIWVLGFFAYVWVHGTSAYPYTVTENILKSIVDSVKLFLFEYNGDAIYSMDADNASGVMAKAVLMILCVLASLSTSMLIISMFVARISSYLSLKFHRVGKDDNHLYVFWGINEAAVLLARSVAEAYAGGARKPYIIFVENPSGDDAVTGDFWSQVEEFCAPPNRLLEGHPGLGDYSVARCRLSSLDSSMLGSVDFFNLTGTGLVGKRISDLLKYQEDAELHVFFLDDNSEENIHSVTALRHDPTIQSLAVGGIRTTVYCHARYDSVNRVVEDSQSSGLLEVKVIDSSHESINLLKRMPMAHPVEFVDLDKDNPGTVGSPFTSMVVGVGETGRDAIRFLYEFGAFVCSSSDDKKVVRSKFTCYAVDARADEIGSRFMAFAPAVAAALNSDGTPLVNFMNHDVHSAEFFKLMDEIADRLNYVVISLGNEELNASVAVMIYSYVRRRRLDMRRFRIFVKSEGESDAPWFESVYDHYNSGGENVIIPFGKKRDIYTYGMIVNDSFVREGYEYYKLYTDLKNGRTDNADSAEAMWKERHAAIMKKAQDNPSAKLDVWSELRRKEHQDISNAYHRKTKMRIMAEMAPMLLKVPGMDKIILDYVQSSRIDNNRLLIRPIHSDLLSDDLNRLIDNLARGEHLRWNASHEMLGYRPYDDEVPDAYCCNERLKRHNCLIPCQELDMESQAAIDAGQYPSDYQSYDYGVVATSMKMELKNQ